MTTPVFTPPVEPDQTLGSRVNTSVLEADFGDGYSQRAPDGLNFIRRTLNISWQVISIADANAIEAFFVARGGHQAFFWTVPGEGAPRKWLCRNWQRLYPGPEHDSIMAEFIQVFDI